MMKLYFMNVRPLLEAESFRKALSFADKQRAEKIKRIKVREEQARSLGAGLLLQYGLWALGYFGVPEKHMGEKDDIEQIRLSQVMDLQAASPGGFSVDLPLNYGDNGKPYLQERRGQQGGRQYYFNLSHSGDYAVCALCDEEIGVDLQLKKKALRNGLSGHIFTPSENRMLSQCGSEAEYKELFFFFFSAKEAYIKLTGQGMRKELKELEISPEEQAVFHAGTKEYLARLNRFCELKDYSLVTARKAPKLHTLI